MGLLNVLKANWVGKVGQTVGAKWKNKSTIRTYTVPSNPDTDAQRTVRNVFGEMTSFVALFSDQIRYLSALNTRGMSVRNAIIKLNKDQVEGGSFDETALQISKGGLPNVTSATPAYADGKVTVSFTAPVATNITAKAKIVAVVVDAANKRAWAKDALLTASSVEVPTATLEAGAKLDVYWYVLDYRGSSKVGSGSAYQAVTVA